jgi:hypothetical protein
MPNDFGSLIVGFEEVFSIVLQPFCERAIAPIAPATVTLRNSLRDCLFFIVLVF